MENESGVEKELTGRERQLAALRANEKATQFGGERSNQSQCITGSNKPWSVKNCLRDFASVEIDQDDIESCTENQLIRKVIPTRKATLIQRGTALKLVQFAQKGEGEGFVSDQIDGKVPQINYNHQLSELAKMTNEQLDEYIAAAERQRKDSPDDGSSGEGNAANSSGGAGSASVENEGPNTSTDTAGV